MNNKQKAEFKKFIKNNPQQNTIKMSLMVTVDEASQEKAYAEVKKLLVGAGIPTGDSVLDANMTDAVKILKDMLKLPNLKTKKAAAAPDAETILNTDEIAFKDPTLHNFDQDEFTFMDTLTQGANPRQINYLVKRCATGLAIGHEPILMPLFFNDADDISADSATSERELRNLASNSLKQLPNKGKKENESVRYLAAAKMELQCKRGTDSFSFLIVTCGQNCDQSLAAIGNDYHGESFIYGGFLAILKILDLSRFDSVKAVIDYKASTKQGTACVSCANLIPTIHTAIKGIEGISELVDNY